MGDENEPETSVRSFVRKKVKKTSHSEGVYLMQAHQEKRIHKLIGVWSIAVFLLVAMTAANYFLSNQKLAVVLKFNEMIHQGANQWPRAQRIVLLYKYLRQTTDVEERKVLTQSLESSLAQFELGQQQIVQMVEDPSLPFWLKTRVQNILFQDPYQLNNQSVQFLNEAKKPLVSNAEQESANISGFITFFDQMATGTRFQEGFQRLVEVSQRGVREHVYLLDRFDQIFSWSTAGLLLILTFVVFIPLARRYAKQWSELGKHHEQLIEKQKELEMAHQSALSIMEDLEHSRAKAERAKKAVSRLATIVTSTSDAIIAINLDSIINEWNEGAERLYGYTTLEAVGMSIFDLVPPALHDDFREHLVRSQNGEEIRNYETVRMCKDGHLVDVEITVSPIRDETGNITGTSSIARDISERKHMQSRIVEANEIFESFMDYNPSIAFIKDEEGRYTYVNRPMEEYFDIRREKMLGKTDFEWLPRKTAEAIIRNDKAVLESGETSEFVETIDIGPEKRYWMFYRFLLKRVGGKKLLGGIGVDITKRLQDEEKLKRYAKEVKRSNDELEHFANIVAHDLNAPVHKIIAFGDLLLEMHGNEISEDAKDCLVRMKNATNRMGQLITDLLRYSRITSQKKKKEWTSLNSVLEDVLSDIDIKVQESGAQIEITPLPEVYGDPVQLRQLFQNLILNAIKFKKEGEKPVIHVDADASWIKDYKIQVQDNGIGFENEYAHKIFEPFRRLHGENQYDGTGMGLAICKKIATNHNGDIHARSELGKGTIFEIFFPKMVNQEVT